MPIVSRLCEKCRKCPFVSKCDKKRMEAMAYLEPKVTASVVFDYSKFALEDIPVNHNYMPVDVNATVTINIERFNKILSRDVRT